MHKPQKIQVIRRVTEDGLRYSIREWDEYLKVRRQRGLPEPAGRFHYNIGFETKSNFEAYHGQFDKQIPLLFEIPADMVEIVTA